MNIKSINLLCVLMVLFIGSVTRADENFKFKLPLSVSAGLGTMESSDLNLDQRTMNALSVEILPSYRLGSWFVGLHLDYRFQGQGSSLDSAGGTNLKGHGYLLGLGLRKNISDKFFIQGSVDFFGEYDLTKDTSAGEDDRLKNPLGFRIKTGYAFLKNIPNLTFDADLQYVNFKNININSHDFSSSTSQMFISLGLTYQLFDSDPKLVSNKIETDSSVQIENKMTIENIEGIKKSGDNFVLNLSHETFEKGSSILSEHAKVSLAKGAEVLVLNSNVKILIEGHSDSTGSSQTNKKISTQRAEAVKSFFVEKGVSADRVQTRGWGSEKPLTTNETEAGRTLNRRVEITITK